MSKKSDEPKKRILAGPFNGHLSHKAVQNLFAVYGKVKYGGWYHHLSGRFNHTYCFVEFEEDADAKKALDALICGRWVDHGKNLTMLRVPAKGALPMGLEEWVKQLSAGCKFFRQIPDAADEYKKAEDASRETKPNDPAPVVDAAKKGKAKKGKAKKGKAKTGKAKTGKAKKSSIEAKPDDPEPVDNAAVDEPEAKPLRSPPKPNIYDPTAFDANAEFASRLPDITDTDTVFKKPDASASSSRLKHYVHIAPRLLDDSAGGKEQSMEPLSLVATHRDGEVVLPDEDESFKTPHKEAT